MMGTILQDILLHKQQEVRNLLSDKKKIQFLERQAQNRQIRERRFRTLLQENAKEVGIGIIAEIKRGSPSLGYIRPDLDVTIQAREYEEGRAGAISVLTDKTFFFANPNDWDQIRRTVSIPLLRKDFIIDEIQIIESAAMQADCILLIMATLSAKKAYHLAEIAHQYHLDVLCEVHTRDELRQTLDNVPFDLLGINNRNLKNFQIDWHHTIELSHDCPSKHNIVAESGIQSVESVVKLYQHGISLFLIGEALVKASSPSQKLREFQQAIFRKT